MKTLDEMLLLCSKATKAPWSAVTTGDDYGGS